VLTGPPTIASFYYRQLAAVRALLMALNNAEDNATGALPPLVEIYPNVGDLLRYAGKFSRQGHY
jgi:hypothetical protein